MKDKTYLAEDVTADGKTLLSADRVIDDAAASVIRENNVVSVKVWRSPETVTVSDSIQKLSLIHI